MQENVIRIRRATQSLEDGFMSITKEVIGLTLSFLLFSGALFASGETDSVRVAYEAGDVETLRGLANNDAEGAALAMATLYWYGKDSVKKNPKLGAEWYLKAAKQGNFFAQYRLSEIYIDGEAVLADYRSAYMWLNLATYNGDPNANDGSDYYINKLKELKKTLFFLMTKDDISEAQKMSSRCLESNYTDC